MEEIFKARVFEYFEDDEKRFIICFKDLSGGPIISSDTIDEAKKKFFDAGKDLMLLEIGESIAAALTGTLFGVFSAYAMFAPVARILEQNAATNVRPYEAVKEILIAHYSNFSPLVAVEYGRKVLYTDQRPSKTELSDSKFNG